MHAGGDCGEESRDAEWPLASTHERSVAQPLTDHGQRQCHATTSTDKPIAAEVNACPLTQDDTRHAVASVSRNEDAARDDQSAAHRQQDEDVKSPPSSVPPLTSVSLVSSPVYPVSCFVSSVPSVLSVPCSVPLVPCSVPLVPCSVPSISSVSPIRSSVPPIPSSVRPIPHSSSDNSTATCVPLPCTPPTAAVASSVIGRRVSARNTPLLRSATRDAANEAANGGGGGGVCDALDDCGSPPAKAARRDADDTSGAARTTKMTRRECLIMKKRAKDSTEDDRKTEVPAGSGAGSGVSSGCRGKWSMSDKNSFFEALGELGKNFEALQSYMARKKGKLGVEQARNRDQIRFFYYRNLHKISKYVPFDKDMQGTTRELYLLVNYGELRKRCTKLNSRFGLKLTELVYRGATTVRLAGKSHRLRTPVCRALKLLNKIHDTGEEPVSTLTVPTSIAVQLVPATNADWFRVQAVAHNPRVRLSLPPHYRLTTLVAGLQRRWRSHDQRSRDVISQCVDECSVGASGVVDSWWLCVTAVDRQLTTPVPVPLEPARPAAIVNVSFDKFLERFGRRSDKDGSPSPQTSARTGGSQQQQASDGEASPCEQQLLSPPPPPPPPQQNHPSPAAAVPRLSFANVLREIGCTSPVDLHEDPADCSPLGQCGMSDVLWPPPPPSAGDFSLAAPAASGKRHPSGGHDAAPEAAAAAAVDGCPSAKSEDLQQQRLFAGWTADASDACTLGHLYITLGRPDKVRLKYRWMPRQTNNFQNPAPKTQIKEDNAELSTAQPISEAVALHTPFGSAPSNGQPISAPIGSTGQPISGLVTNAGPMSVVEPVSAGLSNEARVRSLTSLLSNLIGLVRLAKLKSEHKKSSAAGSGVSSNSHNSHTHSNNTTNSCATQTPPMITTSAPLYYLPPSPPPQPPASPPAPLPPATTASTTSGGTATPPAAAGVPEGVRRRPVRIAPYKIVSGGDHMPPPSLETTLRLLPRSTRRAGRPSSQNRRTCGQVVVQRMLPLMPAPAASTSSGLAGATNTPTAATLAAVGGCVGAGSNNQLAMVNMQLVPAKQSVVQSGGQLIAVGGVRGGVSGGAASDSITISIPQLPLTPTCTSTSTTSSTGGVRQEQQMAFASASDRASIPATAISSNSIGGAANGSAPPRPNSPPVLHIPDAAGIGGVLEAPPTPSATTHLPPHISHPSHTSVITDVHLSADSNSSFTGLLSALMRDGSGTGTGTGVLGNDSTSSHTHHVAAASSPPSWIEMSEFSLSSVLGHFEPVSSSLSSSSSSVTVTNSKCCDVAVTSTSTSTSTDVHQHQHDERPLNNTPRNNADISATNQTPANLPTSFSLARKHS